MKYEIDCPVRLSTKSEYQSLYKWFLSDLDPQSGLVDLPQIPWAWGVNFEAIGAEYFHQTVFETEGGEENACCNLLITRSVRAKLKPLNDELTSDSPTSFSFFGTRRLIEDIRIVVTMLDDPTTQDRCQCWGSLAYQHDVDFRQVRSADILAFYLYISSDAFLELLNTIERGDRTRIFFHASSVNGFYSEWTPGTSTDRIKVLANKDDQNVEMEAGCSIDPPRLGHIGRCGLSIVRTLA